MQFFEQIFISFKYYGETFRFIDRHNLYRLLLIPALLGLLVAFFVAFLAWHSWPVIIQFLFVSFRFRQIPGIWGDTIEMIFRWIINGLTLFLYLKIFRYLLLMVLAPSFMILSKKIQSLALGDPHEFTWKEYVRNIFRSMELAVFNFLLDLFYTTLVIFVVIIITWMIPLAPFAFFLVECYFFGYSMIDYRNQFLNYSVKDSKVIIRKNVGLAVGNGICFNLILLIPLFGIMLGPSLALIAAGLSIDEAENKLPHDAAIG